MAHRLDINKLLLYMENIDDFKLLGNEKNGEYYWRIYFGVSMLYL